MKQDTLRLTSTTEPRGLCSQELTYSHDILGTKSTNTINVCILSADLKKKKSIVLIYSQSNSEITNIQALYLMYLISNNSGLAMLIELSSCATDYGTEGTEMNFLEVEAINNQSHRGVRKLS